LIIQTGTVKTLSTIGYMVGVNDTDHDLTNVPVPWQLDVTIPADAGVGDLDAESGDTNVPIHCFIQVDGPGHADHQLRHGHLPPGPVLTHPAR
jgi:hypothetical protein